ncbi:DUF2975 domain-containing protein [Glutamicibacter sp.]|uniref:DUF2975 domain-containing protein n=1 Tax=Glutamicibacter sp. TaxID=1931995 RepID=UPI002B491950|nr:DUF2975 domain-containing protein [Glutamicibacter sp.]HJX80033.1 DUF2975 domain-containing protein [Glutamicibacter sp.]
MGKLSIISLKTILGIVLAGTLFVQLVMVPMILLNSDSPAGSDSLLETAFLCYLVLAGLIIETCVYCVWKLATRVRRGTVFNAVSLSYVSPIIIAIALGAVLTFAFAAILAQSTDIAPGVVLLFGGMGVLMVGICTIVVVLRQLLQQATMTESQISELRTELGGVI